MFITAFGEVVESGLLLWVANSASVKAPSVQIRPSPPTYNRSYMKKNGKSLKISKFDHCDKEIEVVSLDYDFRFLVDYDDVDHKLAEKRLRELVKVYNKSLEVNDENRNEGIVS